MATVMREVAKGLAYMHASGRIHRDLKAANILVAPDGSVALAGGVPPSLVLPLFFPVYPFRFSGIHAPRGRRCTWAVSGDVCAQGRAQVRTRDQGNFGRKVTSMPAVAPAATWGLPTFWWCARRRVRHRVALRCHALPSRVPG